MIRAITLAALAAFAVPTAAMADTYDVAANYGDSVFSYGYGTGGTSFIPYTITQASNCFGVTSIACMSVGDTSGGDPSALPAIAVNTAPGTATFQTVALPNGTLFFHPGAATTGSDSILNFTAPVSGLYQISGTISRLDTTSNGNGVVVSLYHNGTLVVPAIPFGPTDPAFGGSGPITLAAGDVLSFVVNNNGEYSYDSTGLQATITSPVPEPATWAMMIGGLGLVGATVRRRRRAGKFVTA